MQAFQARMVTQMDMDGIWHPMIISSHDRRYSETHPSETYAQPGQRIAQQGQKCTLRDRSMLETLARLLSLELSMFEKELILGGRPVSSGHTLGFNQVKLGSAKIRAR